MHDPSDLETTIERSFEYRSARLDASSGDLDDVFGRVARRRSRRRATAVMGSVAVVVVGVVGIVALGDRDDSRPAASTGPEDAAVTDEQEPPTRTAWRCDDQLAYWGEAGDEVYFASCDQTTIDDNVEVLAPPAPTDPPNEPPPATKPASEDIGALPSTPQASVPSRDTSFSPHEQLYIVVAGDSVAAIAQTFGMNMESLATYNEWPEGITHPIFIGDAVRIPPGALVPSDLGNEGPTTTSTTAD